MILKNGNNFGNKKEKVIEPDITEEEEKEVLEEKTHSMHALISEDPDTRIVGLYGGIDEEKASGIISMLYHLQEQGKLYIPVDPEKPNENIEIKYEPIQFVISTEGGHVHDMFAVYDVIRDISKNYEISTFGIGKVMSAGLLLLASGTPGKRFAGRNCRFMLHEISSGNFGQLADLKNNLKETKWYQSRYISELCSRTKFTRKKILRIFNKKTDYFFDAEQALEFGLIDEIV